MTDLRFTILALFFALLAPRAAGETHVAPVDISEARELADRLPLSLVEGIWEYPGDGIVVFIAGDQREPYRYNITVVQSDDVRLTPGVLLGTLTESAVPEKFRMSLYTTVKHGLPAKMGDCLATLDAGRGALLVETKKVSVRFTPSLILPLFWNKLRLGMRVSMSDPLDKLPVGLRRIYPETPGSDIKGAKTIYL